MQAINIGIVTRVLQREIPLFLSSGLTTLDIYSDSIVFSDPLHSNFHTKGKLQYRILASSLRRILAVAYHQKELSILHINQNCINDTKMLEVRWLFQGVTRFDNDAHFNEGVFHYRFDRNGRIYDHQLVDIYPTPSWSRQYKTCLF